ncbi:hypothetical protein HK104_005578 [Borealophlyctis nickersoniae]|nr:hypothetical protein HK104_005578 [Borealophlyctis nickersoniae]
MAAQQYITIKAEFNSILRRITLPAQTPPTWATLQTSVKTAHGIPQQFPVKAVDADSGVTVANDRDVSELFSSAQDAGRRSVKLIFSPADADDDTFIVVTDSQLPGTDSNAGGTGDRELPAQKEDNDSELDESDGQTEVVAKGIETLSLADGDDADAETGLSDSGKRDFEASGSLLSSTTSVSSQPSSHTDVASLPDYTAAIPAPATSPSPAAPQTFDEFLAEVNPLITTLISKLESHPEFIPQLVSRFSTTLSSNNWGIIVSGPDETVVTTPVNPATPSGSTNPPPPAVADRYVPPYVWYGVVCDHCGKRAWGGPRYKCVTCADYDLCPSCYTSRTHKHEFHKCLRPDDLWKGVVCDGSRNFNMATILVLVMILTDLP